MKKLLVVRSLDFRRLCGLVFGGPRHLYLALLTSIEAKYSSYNKK